MTDTDIDSTAGASDPHQGLPALTAGEPLATASAALLLVHGRGGTADDILGLGDALGVSGVTYIAPQAAGNSWYPYSFLAPLAQNEPGLSSGLRAIGRALAQINAAGIPPERTILLGFSQGACLTLEYVARHAQRYGGVAGLSGGLIGPNDTPRDYAGFLNQTPVFLGCSDADPHIPRSRVLETATVLERLGGVVTTRLYPHMGHLVSEDEVAFVQSMMRAITFQ